MTGPTPESTPESTSGWLTYAEAAERLGSTPEAVRTRSRRENWPKQRPNVGGGLARVIPPSELLTTCARPVPDWLRASARPAGRHPVETRADPEQDPVETRATPEQPPSEARSGVDSEVIAMRRHIADLRLALERADERAAERQAQDGATIRFLQSQVERMQAAEAAPPPAPTAAPRRRWWRRR
jgi:hypothetical protein